VAVVVGVEDVLDPGVDAEEELPELAPEPEFELAFAVAPLPENGFADPEPQPTTEAIAIAATLNFIKTLEENCTMNSCQFGNATD
jgi:hypothetical protein